METETHPWWQQGDLHDKTLADWLEASSNNRLATALDALMALKEELQAALSFGTKDELLRYVYEMTGCIDAMAQQVEWPEQIPVSRAVYSAAEALGYLPDEAILRSDS